MTGWDALPADVHKLILLNSEVCWLLKLSMCSKSAIPSLWTQAGLKFRFGIKQDSLPFLYSMCKNASELPEFSTHSNFPFCSRNSISGPPKQRSSLAGFTCWLFPNSKLSKIHLLIVREEIVTESPRGGLLEFWNGLRTARRRNSRPSPDWRWLRSCIQSVYVQESPTRSVRRAWGQKEKEDDELASHYLLHLLSALFPAIESLSTPPLILHWLAAQSVVRDLTNLTNLQFVNAFLATACALGH